MIPNWNRAVVVEAPTIAVTSQISPTHPAQAARRRLLLHKCRIEESAMKMSSMSRRSRRCHGCRRRNRFRVERRIDRAEKRNAFQPK